VLLLGPMMEKELDQLLVIQLVEMNVLVRMLEHVLAQVMVDELGVLKKKEKELVGKLVLGLEHQKG